MKPTLKRGHSQMSFTGANLSNSFLQMNMATGYTLSYLMHT